jgi:hypothetical protein
MSSDNQEMWRALNEKPKSTAPAAKSNKRVKLVGGGLAVLALLVGGGVLATNHDEPSKPNPSTSDMVVPKAQPVTKAPAITVDPWQLTPWAGPKADAITSDQKEWVREHAETTLKGVRGNVGLVSEAEGFTSNPDEATTAEGVPNPLYNYWTQELFTEQSALEVQALVNPVFGGWAEHQQPNAAGSLKPAAFAGIFTERFVKDLGKNQHLPVMADWKNDGYGSAGVVPQAGGSYWLGEVVSSNSKWTYDNALGGYRVKVTYSVKFTGVRADGSKVVKHGTLKLAFVPAPVAVAEAGGFRVQVDEASLSVKG